MIKKLLFTLSLCMLALGVLYAQSTIKGEVKDQNGNPIPYLQVFLKQEGKNVNMGMTDDRGQYQLFGVSAGTYDISTGGTQTCQSIHTEKGIYVPSSDVKFVNLKINCTNELEEVEIPYVPPVFDPDNTKSSEKLTGEEVRRQPGRNISAVLTSMSGVASVDGTVQSIRGHRSDGQQTIIDGVRVRGLGGVSFQTIEGLELLQGGIPAEYGDGTSFTIITTRGVAKEYHGSVELRSSLEGSGQMLGEATITGPLLKGKTPQDPARMGFLLSVRGTYDKDSRPAHGGVWIAKPDAIQSIIDQPIRWTTVGERITPVYRANEFGTDDFQKIRFRKDAQFWDLLAQAKIDIMGGGKDARGRSKNNLRFSVSGSYQMQGGHNWSLASSLFNSSHNSVYSQNTLRLNARLMHRVKTDTAANAILKNVMYDISANFQLFNSTTQDRVHQNNIFDYGYIGKFTTERRDYFTEGFLRFENPDSPGDSLDLPIVKLSNWQAPYWVAFDKDGWTKNGEKGNYYNKDLIPYTQALVDLILDKTGVDILTATEEEKQRVFAFLGGATGEFRPSFSNDHYTLFYGLLNGDTPGSIATNLYQAPGIASSFGLSKTREETFGARINLSLNILDHEIRFGAEFDKRTQRSYGISANRLWSTMRYLTYDASYFPLDFDGKYWKSGLDEPLWQYIPEEPGYEITDTLMFNVVPNLTNFDINLRKYLGIKVEEQYLDISSYDPNMFATAGLGLFSNYELLNLGDQIVDYSGFDYKGNISNRKLDLKKFYSGENFHADDKYCIGAFEPIYMGFYLQDKFSISNLLFSLGLRVDYFNANQLVLRDPFLLRPAVNVKDLRVHEDWLDYPFPDNIGDNWIPYVSLADNDPSTAPSNIVAYRNGKIWYNNYGQEINDPASYLGSGGPILVEVPPADAISKVDYRAFTKYNPQWGVMPRISFSFPVSTNSLFYAHYNIITVRPTSLQVDPIAYLFISSRQNPSNIITNPNLRPHKTVMYEIGFRQAVGEYAGLSFGAYYNEIRDQVQSYRLTGAYPNTYYSYENQDFGTTQGFVLGLTMRGAKNLSFRANYTLQFAKGTGSTAGSNLSIIASGQPNLRTLTNLNYDQRHNISATVYLNYPQGAAYNGPKTFRQKKGSDTSNEIRWLEGAGATLSFFAASGMPYSRSGIVYSVLGWGERTEGQLKGNINGANKPWQFNCNLRVDKSFYLNLANKKEKTESGKPKNKPGALTFILDFQNLLNIKSAINVYDYTCRPDSDGFTTSSLFIGSVQNGYISGIPYNSAINYYDMRIASPFNYNTPFCVVLGVEFSF
ncbi:MAG: carboxypeptidase regulatory-like domain-containing protein [Bacteroidales bacterium]|nr:carboxypeptidase regulatory-like domain-containing protein [Bacteroidales bacterium]